MGLALLTVAAPLLVGSAAAVAILSKRSPFIAHLRVGQGGRRLWMLKLRTMWTAEPVKAEERGLVQHIHQDAAPDSKNPRDFRVCSRFAAFCRRHSIDELPQLWHVVHGEMSLVGPRPMTATEISKHYPTWSDELLTVKPGLTGLWQVSGRSMLSWEQRIVLDRCLLQDIDRRLYWKILIKTVSAVLNGGGAW